MMAYPKLLSAVGVLFLWCVFDHGSARIRHLEAKVVDGMSNFVELTFYERAPCLARPNQARGSA